MTVKKKTFAHLGFWLKSKLSWCEVTQAKSEVALVQYGTSKALSTTLKFKAQKYVNINFNNQLLLANLKILATLCNKYFAYCNEMKGGEKRNQCN